MRQRVGRDRNLKLTFRPLNMALDGWHQGHSEKPMPSDEMKPTISWNTIHPIDMVRQEQRNMIEKCMISSRKIGDWCFSTRN